MQAQFNHSKTADEFRKKYRLILLILLIINILGIGIYGNYLLKRKIPDTIRIMVNNEEKFDFHLPFQAEFTGTNISVLRINDSNVPRDSLHISLNEPFSIQSSEVGSYKVRLSLFGLLDLKEINLDVIEDIEVVPCGNPIGITLKTDGILVLGTSVITGADGMNYEPALNILKSGDYIVSVNDELIHTKEELVTKIQNTGEEYADFKVRRNDSFVDVSVKPVKTVDGEYKIGTWIRDDTQGIGTLTFITSTGEFGALGHGITDVDTGVLMEVGKGEVYEAEILSIVKGRTGEPGELTGMILQNRDGFIGTINKNTSQGIYGNLNLGSRIYTDFCQKKAVSTYPIGLKQEIVKGPATILCHVDGKIEEYQVSIEEINISSSNLSKGIILKITDQKLIQLTGGIVQGMSGSPIIQNGKLVGAVTHVFVRDATRGYGIFIENMLQTLEK